MDKDNKVRKNLYLGDEDSAVVAWWEAQEKPIQSIRMLIEYYVLPKYGNVDLKDAMLKEMAQLAFETGLFEMSKTQRNQQAYQQPPYQQPQQMYQQPPYQQPQQMYQQPPYQQPPYQDNGMMGNAQPTIEQERQMANTPTPSETQPPFTTAERVTETPKPTPVVEPTVEKKEENVSTTTKPSGRPKRGRITNSSRTSNASKKDALLSRLDEMD